jgi:hypothetical protein
MYLHDSKSKKRCKSFHDSQWEGCWEVIVRMEGLESVKVTMGTPVQGWLGLSEREVMEPLLKMKGFKVAAAEKPAMAFDTGVGRPITLTRVGSLYRGRT